MDSETGIIEFGTTRDGLKQLRRHWPAQQPRAAVLLVHGIGEHSGRYEHVGQALASAGFDTLSFDARGFGQTDGRRAYVESFDEYVDDVVDLMERRRELGVPIVLMGHSLGGLVVATYLVSEHRQPDLAVLSAPALEAQIPAWQRTLAPVLGRVLPRVRLPADFDGSVLSRDEEVQRAYDDDPLRVGGSTAALGRSVLAAMKSTADALDRITVPLYVLHGAEDELVPPTASEAVGALPDATRRVWPDLLHECLNEPERHEVLAEIMTWLDDQLSALSSRR